MQNIYVSFGIRLRSDEVISVIGERAGRVLRCHFALRRDQEYPDTMILQAEVFCLRLMITQGRFQGDSTVRIYQLSGENIIEPRWDYSVELDLTQWMLQEFQKHDSPGWYVPTLEELKNEAGID